MLHTTLWIGQTFLALFFLAAGSPKLLGRGLDRWVGFDALPRPMTITIGVAEVAAAVALLVPMLMDVLQWTTPLAALGLVTVSLQASGFHIREQEWLPATETALWASLAGTIAIGRWNQISTGPAISPEILVPVVGTLVVGIVLILAVLFRQPVGRRAESVPVGTR